MARRAPKGAEAASLAALGGAPFAPAASETAGPSARLAPTLLEIATLDSDGRPEGAGGHRNRAMRGERG